TANDAKPGDEFGHSVAMSGDFIAVGARRADIGANKDQGAVYVFERKRNGWLQISKLTASNGQTGDEFAHSLAADGKRIAVGANLADGAVANQGAAHVYQIDKN
ncbi:MAG TPA: FG-GAP repeat protein, partial [Burkholderiales bacterium]|nr:FG-GAP repeat protein [Burkholderiales bacterium]